MNRQWPDPFAEQRARMVETQLKLRGITDPLVLAAFARAPRELFVPEPDRADAYGDYPLPIGEGQTVSQPYIVALMMQQMALTGRERVLEIGTGSGYQTALLAYVGCEVFTVERIAVLQQRARDVLESLGCRRIHFRLGDGTLGWPEEAPFDRITVGAAAPKTPPSLVAQLAEGGDMVLPVGGIGGQELMRLQKRGGKLRQIPICGCVFVRLIGKEAW